MQNQGIKENTCEKNLEPTIFKAKKDDEKKQEDAKEFLNIRKKLFLNYKIYNIDSIKILYLV